MKKTLNYIVVGLVFVALAGIGYFGYTLYPKINKCPVNARDTLYIRDTTTHIINNNFYYPELDTVIVSDTIPAEVDTVAILEKYFSLYVYNRPWNDSLIQISLIDTISQNKSIGNSLSYKILRPQQVITNVTQKHYYTIYWYAGLDLPIRDIKYLNVELLNARKNLYWGVGYNPKLNSPSVKIGMRIIKSNPRQ